MSVKAVEQEFNRAYELYHEMKSDIVDIEKEVQEGIVSPEFLDRLKEQIAPIKQNYEWWSYVMFLLHEPQRKSKRAQYRKQKEKFLSQLDVANSPQARHEKCEEALSGLKELK